MNSKFTIAHQWTFLRIWDQVIERARESKREHTDTGKQLERCTFKFITYMNMHPSPPLSFSHKDSKNFCSVGRGCLTMPKVSCFCWHLMVSSSAHTEGFLKSPLVWMAFWKSHNALGMSRRVCHTGTANTHHSDVHLNGGAFVSGKTSDLGAPEKLTSLNWHLKEQALFLGMFCSFGHRPTRYYIPLTCASLIDFAKLGKWNAITIS